MTQPFPLMPPKSTELRLMGFDEYVYTATPGTTLYKFVDALAGTTGVGSLLNQVTLARMGAGMSTIYFTDLDYIFGKTNFLARSPAESYSLNPLTGHPLNPQADLLTSDQWNEVRVKDNWYRSRIGGFFIACGLGGTPDGIRMAVRAALSCDCDIYETWRYIDNFGLTSTLGRVPVATTWAALNRVTGIQELFTSQDNAQAYVTAQGSNWVVQKIAARNEVVVQPHKVNLSQDELRLIRDMLAKFCPLDTIITVNLAGLAVNTPIPVSAAAASSTYFEVQKKVLATPLLSQLPPPELLPIDLLPSETWLYAAKSDPQLAPYAAFNITSEYGYYYLTSGGSASPIDSVSYGTISPQNPVIVTVFEMTGTYASNGPATPPLYANNLDPTYFSYVPVSYQADLYPMSASITQGVTSLVNAINARPGPFILVGYSRGAAIISNVYDLIRTGSLSARRSNLLGALSFGNPRRQAGAIFPGGTDPGGHGVLSTSLLTNTESLWWEFATAGDIISAVGNDTTGQNISTIMGLLVANYAGTMSGVLSLITPAITGATALLQSLLDIFYGVIPATAPHAQYISDSYLPVAGDSRSCVQIGADYITSLALPTASTFNASAGVSNLFTCYEVGETPGPNTGSWLSANLATGIGYMWVPWSASDKTPWQQSVSDAVDTLVAALARNPGRFMLVGTGLGAMVTSAVYDALRTGTLQYRRADLVAAVAFGNPRRQAGTIFPGGTDPGGHGISGTLLSGTESLWWEFANPGDILATTGSDAAGTTLTQLFGALMSSYTGNLSAVTAQFPTATSNTALLASTIYNAVTGTGATTSHATYASSTPISKDTRTSWEIARDYLNSFVASATGSVAPPVNLMTYWKAAPNFQVFDTSGGYTLPTAYDLADSPDNFPGGRYGMHPSLGPALNPDGTPYIFAYPSQAAYIAVKQGQVVAQGGLVTDTTYQLPLQGSSTTGRVFYPEYAVAYYPPAKDSTVSASLTARRNSGQVSAEPTDPVNYVRTT